MDKIKPLAINEEIRTIHEAVAVIAASVQMRAIAMHEDHQATTRMIMDAASTRLAELRNLLMLAAGSGIVLTEMLKPMQGAIDDLFEKTEELLLDNSFHGSFTQMDDMHVDAQRSLDAARIAGYNMLGHLNAAILRVQRPEPTRGPRLVVVDGVSTGG